MKPGLRVIRGPDWYLDNQDGGPGYLGTVVKLFPNNTVTVRWDIGNETVCRAGQNGAFDLRIYDNAQLGVSHGSYCDARCDEAVCPDICNSANIIGIRWKCLECADTDKCTPCYMVGIGKTKAKGAMGAEVTKYTTANKNEQEIVGVVKKLIHRDPDAYRSAVTVEWPGVAPKKGHDGSPELPIYRLGADGKVELNMVKPASPGHVYADHLPVLDLTMPVDVTFNEGDKVRVDLNLEAFKPLQVEYGEWADALETVLGEEGEVVRIVNNGRAAEVNYAELDKTAIAIYLNCLTKISKLCAGDTVKIIQDQAKMKKLQMGHGGWQDALVSILGETGNVVRIDESRDALVDVNGDTYVLNPDCLVLKTSVHRAVTALKSESVRQRLPLGVPLSARRPKPPPGMSVGIGARVVRGPDWSPDFGDQDGGEGHLGSIAEICGTTESDQYPQQCVVVQWDNGERNVYRAGYERAFDLRLYDNAGVGIRHNVPCNGCSVTEIFGMRWQCSECPDVSLCSECYNADQHDVGHHFIRIDTATSSHGIKVPKREMSRKLPATGIFEKAKVQRGPDWRWENQDGGTERKGEVIAIVNFSPDSDRDAAEVTWENGYTNVYRLGYKGRLDVKCVHPVAGNYYYKDHIPVLKLDTDVGTKVPEPKKEVSKNEPAPPASSASDMTGRFNEGDRVRIEIDVDLLKIVEENRGAWNDRMTECIGKTGSVIVSKGNDITVDFESAGRWTFHETVLNKVKEFVRGEAVKVIGSVNHIRMLQTERGGWNELMQKVIGRRGTVEEIDEDGDVRVSFGEYTWTFNPECLASTDEKPEKLTFESDTSKAEDKSKSEPVNPEEEKLEDLFGAIFSGDVQWTDRIIQRDPQLMLMDLKGKYAIHLACHNGNEDIVNCLFKCGSKGALLEIADPEGNTPLLAAVKGGKIDMVTFLVNEGANKEAVNQSSQSAVHMAVFSQNTELLTALQKLGFDINHKDLLHQSPIFDAIISNNDEIIKIVLNWPGVEVDYQDSVGISPFCIACRKGNVHAVSRILELAPDELNKQKQDGYSGLHLAVFNNNIDVVKVLLQQPDIEKESRTVAEQRTPLHVACMEGYIEIAQLLIENGVDIEAVDGSSKTCLHLFADVSPDKKTSKDKGDQNMLKMLEYLVEVGVPFDRIDGAENTAETYMTPTLRDQYLPLIRKRTVTQGVVRDDSSRFQTRGNPPAPMSLPANMGSTEGQTPRSVYNQGPSSLIMGSTEGQTPRSVYDQGSSSLIITANDQNQGDTVPVIGTNTGQGSKHVQQQDNVEGSMDQAGDPDICPVCEEEPVRYKLEPCGDLLCADCAPRKKQKKKRCILCGDPADEVVELR